MADAESLARAAAGLSVPQKAALCLGSDFWHTAPVPECGIEAVMVADGPHGLRKEPQHGETAGQFGSVPATCFPTASALGSSWDPHLAREVGRALGAEARAQGLAVVLGPGINIKRSPLCGRNFEYFSEDPFLAGRMGAALVDGLQSQQVGACVKHFAANNQETDRLRVSADVDERTLREIYLLAFEYVVKLARPWSVMCSYNKINGVYASQHRWLLTEVLRGEWGFDGLVMSDWGAVHDRVAALIAGLDLEMPPSLGLGDQAIIDAVAGGTLDEAVLDQSVARVLHLVGNARRREPGSLDADAHHALARRAAAQSLVLLKNDGVLPLAATPGQTIAVIGEFARTPRFQGAGSSQVSPLRVDVPLDELTVALPQAAIRFAPGYHAGEHPPGPGQAVHRGPAAQPEQASEEDLAGAAVQAATGADVVLLFLGLPPAEESEGFDRQHIDLPPAQIRLLERLAFGVPGTPLVVVLCNGGAVRTFPWDEHASAVLECWLAGQAAGGAVADVLTGAVNPAGRLAETIPLRIEDCPAYLNFPGELGHVRYGEGVFTGYRGYDAADRAVGYPFGHGLSYTSFGYRDLIVTQEGSADAGDLAVTVRCRVRNTGSRAGHEVVQVYAGDLTASVARPPRELRAFTKVWLEPGAEREVRVILTARDLSYWSVRHGRWVLEPGDFRIAVGASSRDIRLTRVIGVKGVLPAEPLSEASTLAEWLAHPAGGPALRATLDDGTAALLSGDLIKMIGSFPLNTLATFGLGITYRQVTGLLSEFGAPKP